MPRSYFDAILPYLTFLNLLLNFLSIWRTDLVMRRLDALEREVPNAQRIT